MSLLDRMRFYKLRVMPDAATKATTFNEQLKPELILEQHPFTIKLQNFDSVKAITLHHRPLTCHQ